MAGTTSKACFVHARSLKKDDGRNRREMLEDDGGTGEAVHRAAAGVHDQHGRSCKVQQGGVRRQFRMALDIDMAT